MPFDHDEAMDAAGRLTDENLGAQCDQLRAKLAAAQRTIETLGADLARSQVHLDRAVELLRTTPIGGSDIVPKDTCTCKLCDPAQTGSTRKPAPPSPSPEVAGPGHAYEEASPGEDNCCAHVGIGIGTYVRCCRPRSDHAVPPIPEGT